MSPPTNQASRTRSRSVVCVGVLLTTFVLALLDLGRACTYPPRISLGSGGLAFLAVGSAAGALLGCVSLLLREELQSRLARFGVAGSATLGVLDALALLLLGFFAQDPRNATANVRVLVTVGIVVGLVASHWFWWTQSRRLPGWLRPCCALAGVGVCAWMLKQLRWNGDDWLRLALHLVLAVCALELVRLRQVWLRPRRVIIVMAFAALTLLGAPVMLRASPGARLALHHRSSHVRSWVHAHELLFDRDRDGAVALFGGSSQPPTARRGQEASAKPAAPSRSRLFGVAAGADVLLLSIDSFRWDGVRELSELREALGSHLLFETAVSPAGATKESLSSTLRGRAVRQLKFEAGPQTGGLILWRDPHPTLAHLLQPAGYRAVTVPTNHYGDPRSGVQSGFESIWVANFDARHHFPQKPPHTQNFVSTREALPVLLEAARVTRGPLCAWIHVMEPHSPYRISDPTGCDAARPVDCYRAALRETASNLARFVREFRALRGKTPVIAVFGDHGDEFGEHGGEFHGASLHSDQVRVGLLLAVPGVPGAEVAAPVSTAALPATLLELLGLAVPGSMTEPSLLPHLAGERPWPSLAVSELRLGAYFMVGYTGERFRYLHDPVHDVELLFDMKRDPLEQQNIATNQPALAAMRKLARVWREAH